MTYVAELSYPGRWLDHEDHAWCLRVENRFHHLERFLAEAAISLNLFEAAILRRERSAAAGGSPWRPERVLRALVRHGSPEDAQRRGLVRQRVEDALRREEWREGGTPEAYDHLAPYVHARAFMAAMDDIGRWLALLESEPGCRVRVPAGEPFGLIGCELLRIAGEEGAGEAPPQAGMLVLESREGRWYALRYSAGCPREVEVSADSLFVARDRVQAAIGALPWRGPGRLVP